MSKTKFSTYTVKYLEVDVDEDIWHDLIETICYELCCNSTIPLIISADHFVEAMIDDDALEDVPKHIMNEIEAIVEYVDSNVDRIELF